MDMAESPKAGTDKIYKTPERSRNIHEKLFIQRLFVLQGKYMHIVHLL